MDGVGHQSETDSPVRYSMNKLKALTLIDHLRSVLASGARVACEEHAEVLVLQDEGNRIVVDLVFPGDERKRRTDERQREAVVRTPRHSGARSHDWHVIARSGIEAIMMRVSAIRLSTNRDFSNAKRTQNR